MAAIYGLIDPRTGDLRYIGKAAHPGKRLLSHMRDASRRDTPVYRWIRKLASLGQQPEMLVLSECEDWAAEERRLIASARARGYNLLNVADGGDEPYCPHEVRSENGRRNSMAREADPKKRAIHRYLQRMGHAFKGATHWDEARRARNAEALQRVKMLARSDPDSLYAMLVEKGHA